MPLLVEKGLISLSIVTKFGNSVASFNNTKYNLHGQTMKISLKNKALIGI